MSDYKVKIFNKELLKNDFTKYVLGVDIGGTNTNIAVAGIKKNKPFLQFSLNFNSQKQESIIPAINETLSFAKDNYKINVKNSCIGAAGLVSSKNDSAILTNVSWNVKTKNIIEKTLLEKVFIINDFQAIGYGINLLDVKNKKDIVTIRNKKDNNFNYGTKAIIGAGTGLGKSILYFDKKIKAYLPIASEGGHSDFPVQNNFDFKLLEYIKNLRKISQPLNYEEIISGRGLESIYYFIRHQKKYNKTKYTQEIDSSNEKSSLISKYKKYDESCKEAFRLYIKYYARCAKNFVLETMATDGLYIAGGIASKNIDIFKTDDFLNEFRNAYRREKILKKIPIYIIVNYDVSLLGTCFACILYDYIKKGR